MTLKELELGKSAIITSVGGEGSLRQHFLDMGVIPGAQVTLVKYAPMGDPMELLIHGYTLTLRLDDAKKIEIVEIINHEKIIQNKMEFDSIKVSFIDENKIYTKQLLLLDELNINNKKIKALTYQNYLIGFEGIDDENIIEKNN